MQRLSRREVEKSEGEEREEHEGFTNLNCRKDKEGEQRKDILIMEAILWLERNLELGKFPGYHKEDPN